MPFPQEASVRNKKVAVGIEPEKVAEGLNDDDGAEYRIVLGNDLLEEGFQRLPGVTT